MDEDMSIVIDNGTGMIKAGRSTDEAPSVIFANVVGRPLGDGSRFRDGEVEDLYIGADAQERAGLLAMDFPIQNGKVSNWDDMEAVWRHTFRECKVEPGDQPCLVTEAPLNPSDDRERMVELLFETFDVPACYLMIQGVAALLYSGRTSGCVVDIGDGVAHIIPVSNSILVPPLTKQSIAGREVTTYLSTSLADQGFDLFQSVGGIDMSRKIKEEACYVALDYEAEEAKDEAELAYDVQIGDKTASLTRARYRAGEVLFNPRRILQRDRRGVHELIHDTIEGMEVTLRGDMYSGLILSGGSTMFEGFADRLTAELTALVPNSEITISAPPERQYSVWLGAKSHALSNAIDTLWITREVCTRFFPFFVFVFSARSNGSENPLSSPLGLVVGVVMVFLWFRCDDPHPIGNNASRIAISQHSCDFFSFRSADGCRRAQEYDEEGSSIVHTKCPNSI